MAIHDSEDWFGLPRRDRLRLFWKSQRYVRFWAVVNEELLPNLIAQYGRHFRASPLSREDIEDCCQEALAPFLNGAVDHVLDPESYISRSVRNACLSEIRDRKRRRRVQVELEAEFVRTTGQRAAPGGPTATREEGDDADPEIRIDRPSATTLVEDVLPEVDASGDWSREVVALALSRLPAVQRRVVEYVLRHDPDVKAEHAAADLAMAVSTYRSNKSRSFSALRDLIPGAIVELGIEPPAAAQVQISHERGAARPVDEE